MWLALDVVVRCVVGVLLVLAGSAKLTSTSAWRELWLASYRLLPGQLVAPVARTLPIVEVACGLALIAGVTGGAAVAAILLGALTLAIVSALARGLKVSCGCFGSLGHQIAWPIAIRNLILTAATFAVALHGHEVLALADYAWPIQAIVLAVALGAAAWFIAAHRRTKQRRELNNLLRASKIGARTPGNQRADDEKSNTQPIDQPTAPEMHDVLST